VSPPRRGELTQAEVRARWEKYKELRAVQQGRVYYLSDDFLTIPGPRFPQALKKLAQVVHAERPLS